MPKQIINIGTSPNDGTGDDIRSVGEKLNSNFNEVYNVFGDGNNLYPYYPIKVWGLVSIAEVVVNPGTSGILTSSPGVAASIVPYSSIGGAVRVADGVDPGIIKIDFPDLGLGEYCVIASCESYGPVDGDHILNVVNKTSSSIWVSNMDANLTSLWANSENYSTSTVGPNFDNNSGAAVSNANIHFMIIK